MLCCLASAVNQREPVTNGSASNIHEAALLALTGHIFGMAFARRIISAQGPVCGCNLPTPVIWNNPLLNCLKRTNRQRRLHNLVDAVAAAACWSLISPDTEVSYRLTLKRGVIRSIHIVVGPVELLSISSVDRFLVCLMCQVMKADCGAPCAELCPSLTGEISRFGMWMRLDLDLLPRRHRIV